MKNRIFAVMMAGLLAAGLCACGAQAGSEEGTEVSGTEIAAVNPFEYDTPASASYAYTAAEQVKNLPEYSPVTLNLSSGFEITDENTEKFMMQTLTYYGFDAVVDSDKTVVGENDWVRVDYTGYLNDEAFEGGAATDQIINVADNCSLSGSGFIPGFTDCLAGAKVGEEISGTVTFPEDYGSESLAGQEAVFVFNVISVLDLVTFDTLTDQMVAQGIGSTFGFQTVEEFKTAIVNNMERNLMDAKTDAMEQYLLKNAEVEIPEDYMEARLNEDLHMMAEAYCSQGQTFEEYLASQNTTLDAILPNIRKSSEETIRLEWILTVIADQMGYELEEDIYQDGLKTLIAGSEQFSDENDVYNYYGCGDPVYGEEFTRMQYRISKVLTDLAQDAQLIFE